MADVFISYSRADYDDFVKAFVNDLSAENIDVWIDQHNLKPGTPDWEQAIRDAIHDSRAVLLVASPDSRKSTYVRSELEIARMEDKPIYPIWAKGEDKRYADCIPMGYNFVQAIDGRGENYGRALSQAVKMLRTEIIGDTKEVIGIDARLLGELKAAAQKWEAAGRPDYLWWKHEQLTPVYELIERINPPLDEVIQTFLKPEAERLLDEFADPETHDYRKWAIIDRWNEIGQPAALKMVEALHYADAVHADRLTIMLRPFANEVIPALITLSKDSNIVARGNVIDVLAKLGDPQAVPILIEATHDSAYIVRRNATWGLGQLGDMRAVPVLIEAVHDTGVTICRNAIQSLRNLGAKEAVPALIEAAEHQDESVRKSAIEALSDFGDPQAIPTFIRHLQYSLDVLQPLAIAALAKFGKPGSASLIEQSLEYDNYNNYALYSGIDVLGKVLGQEAVIPLADTLSDDDPWMRKVAAEILGVIGDPLAAPALIAALSDKSHRVRRKAAEALGRVADPRAIGPLTIVLNDKERTIYLVAASALEQIGTPEALIALERWKAEHPDDYTKWQEWRVKQLQDGENGDQAD